MANIKNTLFKNYRLVKLFLTNDERVTNITGYQFENTPDVIANDSPSHTENLRYN